MIQAYRASERGHFDFGWLDTHHTFSFGKFFDPQKQGFRQLRVLNEDRLQPAQGFESHSHHDMEILSYVLSGELAHKDSLGNGSIIRPHEVQYMSAGTGVTHSEFNASAEAVTHFVQIWLVPAKKGTPPRYAQKLFPREEKLNRWCPLASPEGQDGTVGILSPVTLYTTVLEAGQILDFHLPDGRFAWVQLLSGTARVEGEEAEAGDGFAISEQNSVRLETTTGAEALLFALE